MSTYNGLKTQGLVRNIPCYGDVIMESEERIIIRQFVTFNIFTQTLLVTIATNFVSSLFYDSDEAATAFVTLQTMVCII